MRQTMRYLALTLVAVTIVGCMKRVDHPQMVDELPSIYPDYTGVTIPVGIAPLNFSAADDEVELIDVRVRGSKGGELHVQGQWADFDIEEWHRLTGQNQGGRLTLTVAMLTRNVWRQYKDFHIDISPEPLGEWGLTYRRIAPGYETYTWMGLFQRDLSTFKETPFMLSTSIVGCVNCHTSRQTDPSRMVFHVRGKNSATVVQNEGRREILRAVNDSLGGAMVYPYWHPSGNYCAFSTNDTQQSFHASGPKRIEVFDNHSDVVVYHAESHRIITSPLLSAEDWSENVPVFSADGRTLFFLTAPQHEFPRDIKAHRYSLCRIGFDPQTGTFGERVDTVINAERVGKSVTWPRPSYDGRWLLFTLADYGYFSVWHDESDQFLLDLRTGDVRELAELNSPRADSYHNWSVNSRWVVFTSRRDDGLYTRLYLAAIDSCGHAAKPFLLPQRHPKEYYRNSMYSFNTPDFTLTEVDFDAQAAGREIRSRNRIDTHM